MTTKEINASWRAAWEDLNQAVNRTCTTLPAQGQKIRQIQASLETLLTLTKMAPAEVVEKIKQIEARELADLRDQQP